MASFEVLDIIMMLSGEAAWNLRITLSHFTTILQAWVKNWKQQHTTCTQVNVTVAYDTISLINLLLTILYQLLNVRIPSSVVREVNSLYNGAGIRTFDIINYIAMFAWSRFLNDLECTCSLSNLCYIAQKYHQPERKIILKMNKVETLLPKKELI